MTSEATWNDRRRKQLHKSEGVIFTKAKVKMQSRLLAGFTKVKVVLRRGNDGKAALMLNKQVFEEAKVLGPASPSQK